MATLLGLSDAAVRKRPSRVRQSLHADQLARFGEFARGSAPGAAFATVVTGALAVASPPAAAKAILTVAAAAGAKTAGQILLGAAASIGIGLLAAFAGLYLGLRRQLKGALDDEERHALTRSAVINAAASLGFIVLLTLTAATIRGWQWPVLATLAFMAVMLDQTIVVQPRALRRRHAAAALHDPVAAARRRRRERGVRAGRTDCGAGVVRALLRTMHRSGLVRGNRFHSTRREWATSLCAVTPGVVLAYARLTSSSMKNKNPRAESSARGL